jgi:hypothetical protein
MFGQGQSVLRFRLRTALVAIASVCAILAAGRAVSQSAWWNGGVRPRPFNPVAWRHADEIGNYRTVRSQMISDLLCNHDFHGWSRDEVVELLGEPDWDHRTVSSFRNWDFVYYLGLERQGWASLDDEVLVFRFDTNDRVIEYRNMVN